MQLSVIILSYNVRWFLQQCLTSVVKAVDGLDAEIIVVDNNSADDSCEMVKALFPGVILIENPENTGFPKGNNIGVERAKGKYLCILNPDTVVAEDTFVKTLDFARQQNDCGIVGVKLIDGTGKFLPESKRGIPTPFTAFTRVSGLFKLSPKVFGKYYATHLKPDQSGEVEILVGAFMVLERSLYNEVGGFDENCFMYSDDIDLSFMILKLGKRNFYFADTTVIHYKGESTVRDANYMKRFREAMNFFYQKHFKASPVFDLFMTVGAAVFSMLKRSAVADTVEAKRFLVQDENLRSSLEGLSKPVAVQSPVMTPIEGDCVVFDPSAMSYKDIINAFEDLSKTGATFRIAYKSQGFLIGSDSSTGRGEITLLRNS